MSQPITPISLVSAVSRALKLPGAPTKEQQNQFKELRLLWLLMQTEDSDSPWELTEKDGTFSVSYRGTMLQVHGTDTDMYLDLSDGSSPNIHECMTISLRMQVDANGTSVMSFSFVNRWLEPEHTTTLLQIDEELDGKITAWLKQKLTDGNVRHLAERVIKAAKIT